MKKTVLNLIILAIFCIATNTYSQIGIGTTDPKESLDVAGNIKTTTFSSTWKSMTNGGSYYTIDYIVIYNGVFYKNLTGTNTDTNPNLDTINWKNINPEPEYLHARMNANENVSVNHNIDNLTIIASAGNVGASAFSAGGGTVTLTAGRTYKLTASLNAVNVTGMTFVVYSWYNITAASPIGNEGFFYPVNATSNISSQTTAVAFIKPTVTTSVDLRIISIGGVTQATIDADYGYITVEAL